MMRNPEVVRTMSSRTFKMRAVAVLSMTLVISIVSMLLLAHSSSAALWPKNVRGTVWDEDGRVVPNTPITINILRQSDNSIRATYTATTNSEGFYSKGVLAADWDVGDTIQVIATHGSQQSNSSVANDNPLQYVNVTFPFAIPEFGPGLMGILASGAAVVAVGVAFLVFWKRK